MWSFQPECEFLPNEVICHPTSCPQHCSKPTYFAQMSEQAVVGSFALVKMGDPLPINFPLHEAKCFNLGRKERAEIHWSSDRYQYSAHFCLTVHSAFYLVSRSNSDLFVIITSKQVFSSSPFLPFNQHTCAINGVRPIVCSCNSARVILIFINRGSDLIPLNSSACSSKATKPLLWFCQLSSAKLVKPELFLDGSFPRKIQQQASSPAQCSWALCCQRSHISDVVIPRHGFRTDLKGRIPPPESPSAASCKPWGFLAIHQKRFLFLLTFCLPLVIFHYARLPWIFLTGARQTVTQPVSLVYDMPKTQHPTTAPSCEELGLCSSSAQPCLGGHSHQKSHMGAWYCWLISSRASPRLLRGKRKKKRKMQREKEQNHHSQLFLISSRGCAWPSIIHQQVLVQQKIHIQPATLPETLYKTKSTASST